MAVVLLAAIAIPLVKLAPTRSVPVSTDDLTYQRCGRVFPDPQAFWPGPALTAPDQSPWAKGNAACRAVDFLGWDETITGLKYLEAKLPRFLQVVDLSDPNGPFASVLDLPGGEGKTAGLPTEGLTRERVPMYLVRVTDEASTQTPVDKRAHIVYSLSIHGIERAGVEGGVRAIEDLATWAACEADRNALPTCGLNGPYPHPVMETIPNTSVGAGDALRRTSLWFVLSNPDGWRRGDKSTGRFFYQRYNGNGMDLNRDWPTIGYTFRPYTPFSEPETRSIGKVLKSIKSTWAGGVDLHGQLIDRAFSFSLIGGAQRPFDKDRRIIQFAKGAFDDAERRLSWSPIIKPNDAPPSCFFSNAANCEVSPRLYGVQWGTVWDTIQYTTTGSIGDWIESPIGLGADGIDNEMSMSHVSNCGAGSCFLPDVEQLHVDGNKSLVYAMIHYSLLPEDTDFRYKGDAAWLDHDVRITNKGSGTPTTPAAYKSLPAQASFDVDLPVGPEVPATHEFQVAGPADGVFNGALSVTVTSANLTGVSPGSFLDVAVDRYRPRESDPNAPAEGWAVQNSYYNESAEYLQSGARVDVNSPQPGKFRLRIAGPVAGLVHAHVQFSASQAWPDPGQVAYDVSNLDFFGDLRPFAVDGGLRPAALGDVLNGRFDLSSVRSLVIADNAFLPGYKPVVAAARTTPQPAIHATVAMGTPGAGRRDASSSTFYEFDVQDGHNGLAATLTSPTSADPDLFLQRQLPDGSWSGDLAASDNQVFTVGGEQLSYEDPLPGHYRMEMNNVAGAPGNADLVITFTVPPPPPANASPGRYTAADETALLAKLRAFVEAGGNLVLTDDAVQVVERLGLVPTTSVRRERVYAGNVEFSTDEGVTSTYKDPLAANVQQAGAAEGPNHRHQMSEPVPLGYEIIDPEFGIDKNTMPQWGIDRAAWEHAGGRVVGVVNGRVALGELPLGKGQIRVLGSLLPEPTEEFDHPFGLRSYGVTYSGYETLRNLLDTSASGTAVRSGSAAAGGHGALPATGGRVEVWPAVFALGLAIVLSMLSRRYRSWVT